MRIFLVLTAISAFFAQTAYASPLINEFYSSQSSDWIEIYNPDEAIHDLSQFRLRDLTQTNKLDLSGSISAKGFVVFEWSNKLNNSGDVVKLVLASDDSVVDQISYGDQGGVGAPTGDQAAGRITDGGSDWVVFTSASKGSSNNSSSVFQSPTPSPTNSPTSTKTPTPSKTPTPTKAPTPTKIPSLAKTTSPKTSPIVSLTKIASVKSSSTYRPTLVQKDDKISTSAGDFRESSPTKGSEIAVLGKNDFSPLVVIIPVGGLLFLFSAFYFIRKYFAEIKEWINS